MADNTYLNYIDFNEFFEIFGNNRSKPVYGINVRKGTGSNYCYIGVYNDNNLCYAYAKHSTPKTLINNNAAMNTVYIYYNNWGVNNTSFDELDVYKGHSYTYTTTVSWEGDKKPILFAYDYATSDFEYELNITNLRHTAFANEPVNVESYVNIKVVGNNNAYYRTYTGGPVFNKNTCKTLLNGQTYVSCTSYLVYDSLDNGEMTYGNESRLFGDDRINDIHIWSMSPGYDKIGFAYKDINVDANGNKKINAYAYIHCGDALLNKLYNSDDNYKAENNFLEFKYVPSATGRSVPVGTCFGINATSGKINRTTGVAYICESNNDAWGQRLRDFVKCAYSYNLGEYSDKSFSEIYAHPSYRNNKDYCDFYELIQGKNYHGTVIHQDPFEIEQVGIDEINQNNVNTTYFITNVSNLPINIFDKNLKINFYMDEGEARPPEEGGAGGTDSIYGRVSEGQTLSNESSSLLIYTKNEHTTDWKYLGEIYISVSIVVDRVTSSASGGQSFTVKLADLVVNYDNAKWADENDTKHNIEYNMDDLYYAMRLDFDGQNTGNNGISFSVITDAIKWPVSNENGYIYINKDNNIRDNYNLAEHAISIINITVSLDSNYWN